MSKSTDKNYQSFFSEEKAEAIKIAGQFYKQFSTCKPNKIHERCHQIEKYCEIFDIEFQHYTLNVDNLLEQAGGSATHLYGCINDLNSFTFVFHL